MKKLYNLVHDIYNVLEKKQAAKDVDVAEVIDRFGESMKAVLWNVLTDREDTRTLRMSNIGKTDRYINEVSLWSCNRRTIVSSG